MALKPMLTTSLPIVMIITTYPPRECGIATFSQDLLSALMKQFNNSFEIQICALENQHKEHIYPSEVKLVLKSDQKTSYEQVALNINQNDRIALILIQHEFGFFNQVEDNVIYQFILTINKLKAIVFHTVISNPNQKLFTKVEKLSRYTDKLIVMTKHSKEILHSEYLISNEKIEIIPHGTHLVNHSNALKFKEKHNLNGRVILSTFGLISRGKSIETTLKALPEIISTTPSVLFLIIGKTHPDIVSTDGESYRESLLNLVDQLGLINHVQFINKYLSLTELLELLQLTDIYLFTSNDPNQTVSGTFSYAMSCGCPIISTPIPHAKEVLNKSNGELINFNDSKQLATAVIELIKDVKKRELFKLSSIETFSSTSWENTSITYAKLFNKIINRKSSLKFSLPEINLNHLMNLSTSFGMLQFSTIDIPDTNSGYTLDDNARALIAFCMYYEQTCDDQVLPYMQTYLNFISFCQQPAGNFLNYIDINCEFSEQNNETNLSDSNGRAIWALGYIISKKHLLPEYFEIQANALFEKSLSKVTELYPPRSIAFAIKGMYYYNQTVHSKIIHNKIKQLANRLVDLFKSVADSEWLWFENGLTYANSALPEALLMAWEVTSEISFLSTAKESFDFLIQLTFQDQEIKVVSNKSWKYKGHPAEEFGEQPIDIAYTILALNSFYESYHEKEYLNKSIIAFNWFLGNNHLNQMIYNPCTGGCYDGLEQKNVNLNQGAESGISYLMARMILENQSAKSREIHFERLSLKKQKAHQFTVSSNSNENNFPLASF